MNQLRMYIIGRKVFMEVLRRDLVLGQSIIQDLGQIAERIKVPLPELAEFMNLVNLEVQLERMVDETHTPSLTPREWDEWEWKV